MCFALRYCWWTKSSKTGCIWSLCPSFIGFSQSQLQDKTTIHNSLASGVDCWSFSLKKKTDEKKGLRSLKIWILTTNSNTSGIKVQISFQSECLNVYTPWDKKQLKTTRRHKDPLPLITFQGLWMEKFSKRKNTCDPKGLNLLGAVSTSMAMEKSLGKCLRWSLGKPSIYSLGDSFITQTW